MRKPFVTLCRRTVTDKNGKTRFGAIGIEFGFKDEQYTYTYEEDQETTTITPRENN